MLHTGCDALHPGYGFLSERAELARLCDDNEVVFVGPDAKVIDDLGNARAADRQLVYHWYRAPTKSPMLPMQESR